MSKVTINVDTKTGNVDMTIDGQKMENIHCINIYSYERGLYPDDYVPAVEISVEMKAEKLGENFMKLVRLVTAATNYAKANKGTESRSIDNFLVFESLNAEDLSDVAKVLLGR